KDGIRDRNVTGVQTCALPISPPNETGLILKKVKKISHSNFILFFSIPTLQLRYIRINYHTAGTYCSSIFTQIPMTKIHFTSRIQAVNSLRSRLYYGLIK